MDTEASRMNTPTFNYGMPSLHRYRLGMLYHSLTLYALLLCSHFDNRNLQTLTWSTNMQERQVARGLISTLVCY